MQDGESTLTDSLVEEQIVEELAKHPERYTRARRVSGLLASFFLGQGAVQAVNAVVALLLVRWLSTESYAQFGLAFGFQSTASNLMDLGFASTIIPLVGDRFNDRNLVGRYVSAALRLRNKAFFLLAPATAIIFFAIGHRQHWSPTLQILLASAVLLSLYSSGNVACYSAPYILYRRLSQFYLPQSLSAAVRLIMYGVLNVAGALNAWTAAGLSALNVTVISRILAKRSVNLIVLPQGDTKAAEREIIHYVMPAMPAVIFASFQSQISLFLVSIFGQTVSIAQVAALGRITQLFMVLQVFYMVIIEPYVARIGRDRLLKTYMGFIACALIAFVPVVSFAFLYPQVIVWLLGPKYASLQGVIGWLVLAICINQIAALIYIMNRARKWVFWSGTIFEILLLVGVQIFFIATVGIRNTEEAVQLTLASSFCYVVAHGYSAVLGFIKGSRIDKLRADESALENL